MWAFESLADETYVATRLFLKLDLTPSRESLLQFCEHVRRAFPGMKRFRRRDDAAIVLDEEPHDNGQRRYLRVSAKSLRFGHVGASTRADVGAFADLILTHAPYYLSLSDLDYEVLEIVFGFDLEYAGNHDELVAETLLSESLLPAARLGSGGRVINCQPYIAIALSEDCGTQASLEVKGRTSWYELRSGEYEPQMLSVYLIVRRTFRDQPPSDVSAVHRELLALGEDLAAGRVIPQVVRPLREAIASRR
jgi:hypothetical protein